jgi:hypothetical protein
MIKIAELQLNLWYKDLGQVNRGRCLNLMHEGIKGSNETF